MVAQTGIEDSIVGPGAPDIPGLRFRLFRGEQDFPAMAAAATASSEADDIDRIFLPEEMAVNYANLRNSDPYQDCVLVEVDGEVVGYKRVEWYSETDGTRLYNHLAFLRPEWRGKGLGRALLRHSEQRLREIASTHPAEVPRYYQADAADTQKEWVELLASEDYSPVRHSYQMVRSDLGNIPDLELPDGIEVRPVQPEHYRAIYEAETEAFRDHWGAEEPDEGEYERWLCMWPTSFQPDLWQVAWQGDQVVGMVRNFILEEENRKYNRLRGYTESISMRRPWRRQGIARALIARSFKVLRDLGMKEAALGVDTENLSGALQLYLSMGFQVVKHSAVYRKPMV